MTHRPVPPPPPSEHPHQGYAPGTYYAPGWSPAQMGPSPTGAKAPRRRAPWIIAIVVFLVLLAAALLLVTNSAIWLSLTGATKPLSAHVESPVGVNSRQLVTGNCIKDTAALQTPGTEIEAVPCSQAHSAQVISAFEFPSDADWAGAQETQHKVVRSCSLSTSETEAGFTLLALVPTADSWKQGDRTGLCVAVAAEPVSTSLT